MSTYKEIKYNFSGANLTNIPTDPTVTSISPSSYEADELPDNITITGTNFNNSVTVDFVGNDGTKTASPTVTFTSSTSITASVPSSLAGADNDPYDIVVASSLSGTGNNLFSIDDNPVFATAAGSLGTITDGTRSSYSLSSAAATDPEGVSVTHSKQSGSLPAGLTLNSDGTITGTATAVGSDTTSTFTVRATAGSQTSDRQFTITVLAPVTTAFTTLGAGSHTPNFTGNMRVLVVAGGGGGDGGNTGGHNGGGGGGGVVDIPSYAVTNGTAVPYYVGAGNPQTGNSSAEKGTGENSTWGANDGVAVTNSSVITALGGGASNTGEGGSGGGRSHSVGNGAAGIQTNSNAISADSRTYGFGNNGGNVTTSNYPHPSGGGGGAGGVGGNGGNNVGGTGGNGKDLSSTYGTSYGVSGFFAGGGGGGCHSPQGSPVGGTGRHGGGNGAAVGNTSIGNNGTANTGGGAGSDAKGGSGVIIIKY